MDTVEDCRKLRQKDRQTHTHMDGRTDGQTLPSALSPCFAKAMQSIMNKVGIDEKNIFLECKLITCNFAGQG